MSIFKLNIFDLNQKMDKIGHFEAQKKPPEGGFLEKKRFLTILFVVLDHYANDLNLNPIASNWSVERIQWTKLKHLSTDLIYTIFHPKTIKPFLFTFSLKYFKILSKLNF